MSNSLHYYSNVCLRLLLWFGLAVQEKDGEGAKELQEMGSERMKVVQLDVCSDEQAAQAAEFVKANLEDAGNSMPHFL